MTTNRRRALSSPLSVTAPSPTESNDVVVVGDMAGVALTDYDSDTGKATVAFHGVYELAVSAVDADGDSAIVEGDSLYASSASPAVVSKNVNHTFLGYAMSAVDAGEDDTILVRLADGGSGAGGEALAGLFISDEETGTGSNQNVAHTLGRVPTKVVAILSEFLSNQSIDISYGTHTNTNAVVNVASGVKFRVLAY